MASNWSFSGLNTSNDTSVAPLVNAYEAETPIAAVLPDSWQLAFEKVLVQPVNRHSVAVAPVRRLIAIATTDKQIECFRFNGSRAFWHKRSGTATIVTIAWLKHKDYLQVAWSDGKLEGLDPRTGKPATTIQLRDVSDIINNDLTLCHFTTAVYQPTDPSKPTKNARVGAHPDEEVEAFLSSLQGPAKPEARIPQQMMFFDIQEELPKLSILPVVSPDNKVLKLATSEWLTKEELLDETVSLPYKHKSPSDQFALHISVWSDGKLSFVDESSDVLRGTLPLLPEAEVVRTADVEDSLTAPPQLLNNVSHAWNESLAKHAFLLDKPGIHGQSTSERILVKVNFSELHSAASYLDQLNFTLKRLQSLSAYLLQILINVRTVYQGWRRLPGIWLEDGNDLLAKSSFKLTLPDAMYRFAVTGDMVAPLRHWIREFIAPSESMQSYQRWQAAVHDGYTAIIDAMHNCFLPAIDRVAVVSNRLRVLNRMSNVTLLNIDKHVVDLMSNNVDALRLLGHAVLHHAATESRQFSAFAPWLSNMIQFANAEPGGATAKELGDKLAHADFAQILPYMVGPLQNSKLEELIGTNSEDVVKTAVSGLTIAMDDVKRAALEHKHKEPRSAKSTTNNEIDLLFFAIQWSNALAGVIQCATTVFKKSVKIEHQRLIGSSLSSMKDIKIVREADHVFAYAVAASENQGDTMVINKFDMGSANQFKTDPASADQLQAFFSKDIVIGDTAICRSTTIVSDSQSLALYRSSDAAQISKLPLQDTAADRVQVLATFPLSSGGLPADFVPDILVYEAGRYVLIDETRRRIRVYNDREVNKAGVQGPQGNPEVPEEEL